VQAVNSTERDCDLFHFLVGFFDFKNPSLIASHSPTLPQQQQGTTINRRQPVYYLSKSLGTTLQGKHHFAHDSNRPHDDLFTRNNSSSITNGRQELVGAALLRSIHVGGYYSSSGCCCRVSAAAAAATAAAAASDIICVIITIIIRYIVVVVAFYC
jgi:hypothetical protein